MLIMYGFLTSPLPEPFLKKDVTCPAGHIFFVKKYFQALFCLIFLSKLCYNNVIKNQEMNPCLNSIKKTSFLNKLQFPAR